MEYLRYIPMGLLTICLGKLLIMGFAFADAPVIISLAALTGFFEFKLENKKFVELETKLKEISEKIDHKNKEIDEVKNYVSGIKMAQSRPSVPTQIRF